jgi:hypothetical protein
MNFIAHFYMDRHVADSLFFVGVSTPDWVSIFNRSIRVKENRLPLIMENEATPAEMSFYNGAMRHLEVDRVFHTSAFFAQETRIISDLFKQYLPQGAVPRSFFVAHVMFELVLDKVLIQADPSLLPAYYQHLESCRLDRMVQLTEWITSTPMPGYDLFLKKFIGKKYLYQYTDWNHVIYVLRRLLARVGVDMHEFLDTPEFWKLAQIYEDGLAQRHHEALLGFGKKLVRI